jgi:hypothetical protein
MTKPVVLLAALFALFLESAFAQAAQCPVINGRYSYIEMRNGRPFARHTITMFTRIAGKVFSFTVQKYENWQVADGVDRPIKIGDHDATVRLTCKGGTLFMETRTVGTDVFLFQKFTPRSRTELYVETTLEGRTGLYILQE